MKYLKVIIILVLIVILLIGGFIVIKNINKKEINLTGTFNEMEFYIRGL